MRYHVIILTEHSSTPQICTTIIYTQLANFTFAKGFRKCTVSLYFRVSNRRTTDLLIIPFFATLPNLIQHSPFNNFGEFCQPPLLFQTPRLLIYVHSRQRYREAQTKPQNCLMYMFFYKYVVYKHIQAQVWTWFFMQINYLCISYVLFVDIIRSFDGFI